MSNKSIPILQFIILISLTLSGIQCSFQFDLFRKIASQNENDTVFFSPLNTIKSLYLTAYSSDSASRKEIIKVLEMRNMKQLDRTIKEINTKLISSNQTTQSNQIFSKEELKENFVSLMTSFSSNITNLTKAKQVNAWCSKITQGKISKVIGNIRTVDMMTLTSFYFNGTWKYPFDISQTSSYSFTDNLGNDAPVDFMSASFDEIGFFKNEKFQMIELPFVDSDISTLIIIPSIDIDELLSGLNENIINKLVRKMEKKKIKIALPKCNIETQISLASVLKELGLKSAFEQETESLIAENSLSLGSFTAKTVFQFNEIGSTVASVNYEVYNGISEPESKEGDLVLSRPFIVIMRHNKIDNVFLLMGKVSNLE